MRGAEGGFIPILGGGGAGERLFDSGNNSAWRIHGRNQHALAADAEPHPDMFHRENRRTGADGDGAIQRAWGQRNLRCGKAKIGILREGPGRDGPA